MYNEKFILLNSIKPVKLKIYLYNKNSLLLTYILKLQILFCFGPIKIDFKFLQNSQNKNFIQKSDWTKILLKFYRDS
ncbi:hypothetical protein [Leptospira interrogans]|uniref:hypothetical protein n=1 Tax=Leptospira interrogans TaxID=173 RepID=UPI000773744C|nr:hypothetical protein [Leptospira interrogans]